MALSLEEIVQLAADQYSVNNAADTISSVLQIEDVFAPPFHGPRHIPIHATLDSEDQGDAKPDDHGKVDLYTHFPIVNSGTYYLFMSEESADVEVVDMHYNGPSQQKPHYPHIELVEINYDLSDTPFSKMFQTQSKVIFNQGDPQPIVLHFAVDEGDLKNTIKYIVV